MNEPNGSLLSSKRIERLVALFLVVASLLVAFMAIDAFTDLFEPGAPATNTISVDGMGTATAIPDIATISFSVMSEGKTAAEAQDAATKTNNVALALLKEQGIADTDVKTTSYTVQPKYSWPQPCYNPPCVYDEQRVVGYTVNQSTEVKVRDLGTVGALLSALGTAGISQLYGPNFQVEDEDTVRAEARKEAIEEARAKAQVLARDLGVRLVRVVSFSENAGGYPLPYDRAYGLGGATEAKAVPELAVGENEIVSQVYITYEIR